MGFGAGVPNLLVAHHGCTSKATGFGATAPNLLIAVQLLSNNNDCARTASSKTWRGSSCRGESTCSHLNAAHMLCVCPAPMLFSPVSMSLALSPVSTRLDSPDSLLVGTCPPRSQRAPHTHCPASSKLSGLLGGPSPGHPSVASKHAVARPVGACCSACDEGPRPPLFLSSWHPCSAAVRRCALELCACRCCVGRVDGGDAV